MGTFADIRGEGRTLADTDKLTNVLAESDGIGGTPGHSELHETSTWKASKLFELLGQISPRRSSHISANNYGLTSSI